MKTLLPDRIAIRKTNRIRSKAFTLVELMISLGIFTLAMLALIMVQVFAMKQNKLVESMLGAGDAARQSFGKMAKEIRAAGMHTIGNMDGDTLADFTAIPAGTLQRGNALLITNTLNAIVTGTRVYYFETNTPGNYKLYRISVEPGQITPTPPELIVDHLTNSLPNSLTFAVEDFQGTNVTELSDRRLIHYTLDFCEYRYPLTKVGSNCLYDRYTIDFRLTPHVPGGR